MGLTVDAREKRFLIRGLALADGQGGNAFQSLLDGLSIKELQILGKYSDLVARVREIASMTTSELMETLSEDYKLAPLNCYDGQFWIGTEKLEDSVPDWFVTEHCGWMVNLGDGEYDDFARRFLMQEVRINIWIRYMEYKKKNPTKQGKRWSGHGNYL